MTDNQNHTSLPLLKGLSKVGTGLTALSSSLEVLYKADAYIPIYAKLEQYFKEQGSRPKGDDISRLAGFVSTMQNKDNIEELLIAVKKYLIKERLNTGGGQSAVLTMDGFQRVISEALENPTKKNVLLGGMPSNTLDGVTLDSFNKRGPSEGEIHIASGIRAADNAIADVFSPITGRVEKLEKSVAEGVMRGAGVAYEYSLKPFEELPNLITDLVTKGFSGNMFKRMATPTSDLIHSGDVVQRLLDLNTLKKYTGVDTANQEVLAKDQLRMTAEHEGRTVNDVLAEAETALTSLSKDIAVYEAEKPQVPSGMNDAEPYLLSYAKERQLVDENYLQSLKEAFSSESSPNESPDNLQAVLAQLHEKIDALSSKVEELQAQKAAEEKPETPSTEQPKQSEPMDMRAYFDQKEKELEQGATLLKAFFDELAPVTEQFGKLKDILSSLLAPEDMAALEAKTQAVAAKEGDATAQDFNSLIDMLKQLLEKVNIILDPETGLLSPKDDVVPQGVPATGGGNATGDGPSTVQEAQKKGEVIEAQLEAWDEIVRKFGENAVGAFENMLESGEISIKGLTKMLVQMAKKALIMQVIPRLFGFNSFGTEAGGMFNGLFGKETGGRVSVGMPYLVGEKRPEIFIPDSPGVIAARIGGTGAKVAGAGNQANVTQNINFTTDVANSVRAEVYNATPHIVAAAHQAVFDTLKGNRRY